MPAALTYPGVYIEELPSGVHTITGVATSITAFVGQAKRGPVDEATRVQSFAEFERTFGGLWVDSTLGYAVSQFFQNGGGDALIVRVASQTSPAAAAAQGDTGRAATAAVASTLTLQGLAFVAKTPGKAGDAITAEIANVNAAGDTFDLKVGAKTYAACNLTAADPKFVGTQLGGDASGQIQLDAAAPVPASVAVDGPKNLGGGADAAAAISGISFVAASPGEWGSSLEATIDIPPGGSNVFNLTVKDDATGVSEKFLNLTVDPKSPRYVINVLENGSNLVRVDPTVGPPIPMPGASTATFSNGKDGPAISDTEIQGSPAGKTGLYALEDADLFNLLCIPPLLVSGAVSDLAKGTRDAASQYCAKRRAVFIADPSTAWTTPAKVIAGLGGHMDPTANAALYFPMISAADPLRENQIEDFAPCGAVAGVMARTDANRGVWKAPAGIEATVAGASALTVKLTDGENGQLNPLGVNCLRSFPVIGRVVWGARTMRGADQLADQWKYVPVRRLALYIEESLFRGTQWVVFEPNDEPLWAQIRLNVGAFMNTLFRQGAFQGASPKDAYFVKCNSETTTQADIDNGIVNIIVGFAPLKPAEFVVIQIQQIAGQIQT
jgi:phage tail sheath protein FI